MQIVECHTGSFPGNGNVAEMFDNMNPVILYDIERNHPATYKKFKEYKYKFLYELVKENIERGKKEELYGRI